jgi:hypothetical protein
VTNSLELSTNLKYFMYQTPHHAGPDFTVEKVAFLLRFLKVPDTDTVTVPN